MQSKAMQMDFMIKVHTGLHILHDMQIYYNKNIKRKQCSRLSALTTPLSFQTCTVFLKVVAK